ncbi:MAG: hypothetical protein QG673_743 [Pseudomonadota bacterium]|nr:hypothetical protein [Pseudomonadota bacterium]
MFEATSNTNINEVNFTEQTSRQNLPELDFNEALLEGDMPNIEKYVKTLGAECRLKESKETPIQLIIRTYSYAKDNKLEVAELLIRNGAKVEDNDIRDLVNLLKSKLVRALNVNDIQHKLISYIASHHPKITTSDFKYYGVSQKILQEIEQIINKKEIPISTSTIVTSQPYIAPID